jgi:L,D-peptidoglycan transpeptidase YkuD (ErfK/YbiS/YcfS/YnhG family)
MRFRLPRSSIAPSGRPRSVRLVVLATLIAVLTQLTLVTAAPSALAAGAVPAGITQLVTVVAPSRTAQLAELRAYDLVGGQWQQVIGPLTVRVGAMGVGATNESLSRTPAGDFPLTGSFGRKPNPGTTMPYFQTDTQDWWDSNPASPTYNLHVRRATSPGGNSENLYRAGAVYDHAIVIGYNTKRVPGAGSAIFLHISNGRATAGCVATNLDTVVALLRWLRPAANPQIRIRPL